MICISVLCAGCFNGECYSLIVIVVKGRNRLSFNVSAVVFTSALFNAVLFAGGRRFNNPVAPVVACRGKVNSVAAASAFVISATPFALIGCMTLFRAGRLFGYRLIGEAMVNLRNNGA